ncbi:MAG: threonine synthase [Burkholderiaceae bacterium]|jgi:threonine synthase
MHYLSTRGGTPPQTFSDVLLGGLCADGGLSIPAAYPQVDAATLQSWRNLSYAALAFEVLKRFATDLAAEELQTCIHQAYTAERFGTDAITPLRRLADNIHFLELSNGPTLAFKDIAMQLLGQLFEAELARKGQSLNILGATSGDTGSAAEYAMRGKRGIRVFMLSPLGKMSAFQRAQMYSLHDPNIFNVAVEGVFDDCQDIVKAVSEDLAFKTLHRIGTVNSINWGRISAQVVYYFKAYLALAKNIGDPVDFCVPSGNFGNVLAGHVARQMGLPIRRLIVATNENDVLDEFFKTGVYRPRASRETFITSSPSMDISKASNFERFVYDLVGRDPARLNTLWRQLATQGFFDVSQTAEFAQLVQRYGLLSGRSTHADRLATIRDTHTRYDQWIDPHTADGLKVAREYDDPAVPMVVLETALPVKFADTIVEATGQAPPRPAAFDGIEQLPQRVAFMETSAEKVKAFIAAHTAD